MLLASSCGIVEFYTGEWQTERGGEVVSKLRGRNERSRANEQPGRLVVGRSHAAIAVLGLRPALSAMFCIHCSQQRN